MIQLQIVSALVGTGAGLLGMFMLIGFLVKYFSNRQFKKVGRVTTGIIVGENCHSGESGSSYVPVVEYYDTFKGEIVQREIETTVLHSLKRGKYPTHPIQVQYTEKKVRLWDERYVRVPRYSGKREGITALICGIVMAICYVLLIVALVMEDFL